MIKYSYTLVVEDIEKSAKIMKEKASKIVRES